MKSGMDVQFIAAAFKISRWPRLISCQKGGLPNGSPKLSMTSVLPEALPQEEPQVAKAAFSIRRTTCRANGIRQFYVEAGAGPPVILLHGFPETSFAWRFQMLEGVKIGSPKGDNLMPLFAAAYSDAEIAAVSNYVIGHFGGKQGSVTSADVRAARN
jgi:hypothetical protein